MKYHLALVTGATSGLGRALCLALAKENIALIAVGRNIHKLRLLAAEIQTPIQTVQVDLSQIDQRFSLCTLIQKECPDLVINSAGFGLYGPALQHPLELSGEMIQVNVQAVTELSLAAAFFSYPNFSVYAASKAFVYRFSEALDVELSTYKVRVLTVCPGQVATNFRKNASQGFSQKPDHLSLSCEKAVRLILKQIKQGNRVKIIDLRYRLSVFLTHFIPNCFLLAFLQKSLNEKYRSKI